MFVKSKHRKLGYIRTCKECRRASSVKYRRTKKGKMAGLSYRKSRSEELKQYWQERYKKDKEKLLEQQKTRYNAIKDDPEFKNKRRKQYKKYAQTDRAKRLKCNRENKRRANKLKATPPWADLTKIEQIYLNCPKGFHVDHIIPLRGKNVCGLHVENNLQYLPASENLKKGNRLSIKLGRVIQ